MTQPILQTHEAKLHLYYPSLDVYWALADLLINQADGYLETSVEIDGETWDVRLNYSDSGIAPRPSDSIDRETVYEFDLTAHGYGQRKLSTNFSPRWDGLATPDGDHIDTVWDHMDHEGVDGHVQASNLDVGELPHLIARFLVELAGAADYDWNQPLDPGGGRIYELERYLRLNADQNKKLIGETGIMQRLMMLLAEEQGTQAEYAVDNEGRVGHYHALQMHSADVAAVFPRHRPFGRQLKSYLPREADAFDADDALYHPKVGALFRKSLSDFTIDWDDRDDLVRELDETVLNALAWSDVPLDVGRGEGEGGGNAVFVPDDHFDVEPRVGSVPIYPDPTPELEARQESVIAWALGEMTHSDRDVLETLAADGGQHKDDLRDATGWSESTLYRVLQRLEGAIESQQGHFRFASRKFRQEVAALIEQWEDVRDSIVAKAERLTDYEIRSRSSSSFERWLAEYGAEFVDAARSDDRPRRRRRPVIRIDTVLSTLKSPDVPQLSAVVSDMIAAWTDDYRDIDMILDAVVEVDLVEEDGYRAPVSLLA